MFSAQHAELITYHQINVTQETPAEGWVESDPMELLHTVLECINKTVENLQSLDIDPADIKAIGVCNQRETTIVWDKTTGKPLHNAISTIQVSALSSNFYIAHITFSLARRPHKKHRRENSGKSARR